MWRTADTPDPVFTDTLELDLDDVQPSLAGPKRPQDRVTLDDAKAGFDKRDGHGVPQGRRGRQARPGRGRELRPRPRRRRDRGDHVLHQHLEPERDDRRRACSPATRSPRACARSRGSRPRSRRASQVVAEYLEKAGLQDDLDALGFNLVGFGCTTCIGNSGPLPETVSKAINDNDLVAGSVLSGNRNFEGRVNPDVRANYLASPPLVVAYALAGSMLVDLARSRSAPAATASRSTCKDIWPSSTRGPGLHRPHHHRRAVQGALRRRVHGRRATGRAGAGRGRADLSSGASARPTCRTRPISRA